MVVLAGLPLSAHGDVGTPLLWAGMLHLVFGNAVIGVVEGLILAWLFKLKKIRTVLVMIGANYFSAWFGDLFLEGVVIGGYLHTDLNNGWRWFWIMAALTYFMTLALEWPFVAFCLRGSEGWWRKSLKGNFIVQTVSYVALFGWYWAASGTSLYTKMKIVDPVELKLPENVAVYFISETNGDVYVWNGSSKRSERFFELRSTNENDSLTVKESRSYVNSVDLVAALATPDFRSNKFVVLKEGFDGSGIIDDRTPEDADALGDASLARVQRLGNAEKSHWSFSEGFWAVEGLHGTNDLTGDSIYFAYETLFGQWVVRSATQLPDDKVIFQLGDNQICVADPNAKEVALLLRGRGPVVAMTAAGRK